MTREEIEAFLYESIGACYWCADIRCEHNDPVVQVIIERWDADLTETWERGINTGRDS